MTRIYQSIPHDRAHGPRLEQPDRFCTDWIARLIIPTATAHLIGMVQDGQNCELTLHQMGDRFVLGVRLDGSRGQHISRSSDEPVASADGQITDQTEEVMEICLNEIGAVPDEQVGMLLDYQIAGLKLLIKLPEGWQPTQERTLRLLKNGTRKSPLVLLPRGANENPRLDRPDAASGQSARLTFPYMSVDQIGIEAEQEPCDLILSRRDDRYVLILERSEFGAYCAKRLPDPAYSGQTVHEICFNEIGAVPDEQVGMLLDFEREDESWVIWLPEGWQPAPDQTIGRMVPNRSQCD